MTVPVWTKTSASRHPDRWRKSHDQRIQSIDRMLLGFWSLFINPHYIQRAAGILRPSTLELIDAAEKIGGNNSRKTPELTLLRFQRLT